MGRRSLDKTRRVSVQRMEARCEFVRNLVDAGSPRVVRGPMAPSTVPGGFKRKYLPSIGDRSGKLTIAGYIKTEARGGLHGVIVKCDCGQPEYMVEANNFKAFKTTRCDLCAKKAAHVKHFWKYISVLPDDEHRRRLLNRLAAAIGRCTKPNDRGYHNYGGRGIFVHPEWRANRASFLQYVQTIPGWDDPKLEMDRADTNGNYEPGNIRFISRSDNNRNRRKISILEAECASLRSIISRLEAQIHGYEQAGPPIGP